MRQALAVLIAILLLVPKLAAQNNNDWARVKKLKRGTSVEILLWSGGIVRGKIDGVTDAGLNLDMIDRGNSQIGLQHELDRAGIHEITTVRQLSLPDSHRWIVTGAVAGAGIGLAGGAVADIRHGGNYHWLEGAFGGALAGLLLSCLALGAVGVVDLGHADHREKVVYSADAPPNPLHTTQPVQGPAPLNPPTTSARNELEELQKQNGLTFSFVDFQGIEVLNFKKKAFAFRALSLQGNDIVGAVSRDGTEIAVYPPHDTEILSLIVMHPDGSSRREYSGIRASPQMCWSYDSAKLAMVARETTLQVIELGPRLAQELPIHNLSNGTAITSQCFSPEGKQIVYESNDGYVSEYDVNNRTATRLAKGKNPTWSPDGNWIAYRDGGTYYAIHPSGEGRKKLFHKTRAISALYWSPDSRFVAYIHQDFFGTLDVEIYHLMIRRLADGVEDSMGGAAPGYNYQWVRNPQLLQWVDSRGQED